MPRFRFAETEGNEVACTNPNALAGLDGPVSASYYPLMLNNPAFRTEVELPEGIETPFLMYREVFTTACAEEGDADYLELTLAIDTDDPRMVPYHNPIEGLGWGLHLTDFNNVLGDLVRAVELQADAAGL